jgi:hypothetical protein
VFLAHGSSPFHFAAASRTVRREERSLGQGGGALSTIATERNRATLAYRRPPAEGIADDVLESVAVDFDANKAGAV